MQKISTLYMKQFGFYIFLLTVLFLSACNITKHVPDGEYLLDKVNIHTDNNEISKTTLEEYLRQTPNPKVLNLFRLQLGIYNIAGKDTSSNWNKSWMRMGAAPIIYNDYLTQVSAQQLQKVFVNKGFVNAKVDTIIKKKDKKASVDYYIKSNKPYIIRKYNIRLKNSVLAEIANDTSRSLIRPGMLFNIDLLDAERTRVVANLREKGYYNFNKDYLIYSVDSTLNAHIVDINMDLRAYLRFKKDSINELIFKQFKINKVVFYTNSALTGENQTIIKSDTTNFRNFQLISDNEKLISLDALVHNTFISPNTLYSDKDVDKTYSALNSLGPVKYVNISFSENGDSTLNCSISIIPSKTISLSTEVEGTYTEGYWGTAAKLGLINKNAFKGAETLTAQARFAYEWQQGIWARELGGQLGLKFPRFLFPIGGYDFKRNMHANTQFTTDLSYQDRPSEFKATNVSAGINYLWDRTKFHHNFEFVNLSFMAFDVDSAFRNKYLTTGEYNKYNYDNRFVLRMGYTGSFSNYNVNRPLRDYSTYRYSIESAGNLLYAINHLFGSKVTSDGTYELFKVRYSQYIRAEYNTSHYQIFDKNNRIVYHLGAGIGVPYGNADIIPYERRFYSGGANSVRGWSESTLGPGVYKRDENRIRDYNQVGDIKLDLNMEYRTKMFWLIEGALFLDGGNVWTIKSYDEQAGGVFKPETFLKQIAIAYGVGFRFDFSFFIARIDLGMKLYDPTKSRLEQWRIVPDLKKDLALHIAIGYPF